MNVALDFDAGSWPAALGSKGDLRLHADVTQFVTIQRAEAQWRHDPGGGHARVVGRAVRAGSAVPPQSLKRREAIRTLRASADGE